MDETYVKIQGAWKYLYRTVDKAGQTIDFLFTPHCDKKAALRFLFEESHLSPRPAREGCH
jgi:transposase-like protein